MPEITAYHEAGHAFMAVYLGACVRSVTIEPDRDDGPDRFGDTQIEWDRSQFSDREFHEKSVFVALAGPVFRACDEEVRCLMSKVDFLRQQKKGLMQQLLTGKVRVNVDAEMVKG